MGKFYYDKKGYPRWRDSDELVHRTVSKPKGDQVVHHKDENKKNFRKDNLENMDRSSHSKLHAKKKKSSWW
jgi:hypothetical protein